MHISLTVGAIVLIVILIGALGLWYVYKPSAPSLPTSTNTATPSPITGAVTESDALGALQSELDAATSQIDTTSLENSLLQK